MQDLTPISAARLEAHLRVLTEDIGVRLAGSEADRRAVEYVSGEFERVGARVAVETFPVRERAVRCETLEILVGDSWQVYPCSLFSSTPGTGGAAVEAPLVFYEAPAESRRPDLSCLKGKAVVHLGCHIESRESYRRLIEAEPAFLLFVDVRFPGTVPLADGMFPAYTDAIGAVPTVNVAYMDAWHWKVTGALAARLRVEGGMRESSSANVVAELPGAAPDALLLVLGAHHDTQANSVGADDNASGVAALLELARVLAPLERKHDVRLISFGAEEQLSVGSAVYVRRHRRELEARGCFMFNFDSFGSHLGWTVLNLTGPDSMTEFLLSFFDRADQYVKPVNDLIPYTDLFPFVAAGVPGGYLGRANCAGGRFFHHRPDDDMSRVAPGLMAGLVQAVAAGIAELAVAERMPFGREIPAAQRRTAARFWDDLFGGWDG